MLRKATDRILSDPRFKNFIEKASKQEMENLLKYEAEDFEDAWEEHKEQYPLQKAAKANEPRERRLPSG